MAEITVFFRDDDVGRVDAPLRSVAALLAEAGAPCSYQVVPLLLDDASAAWVREWKREHGARVAFHQHGLRHQQEVGGQRRWSEFDAGRPFAEQRADIAEGRRRLEDLLGEALDPDVFTPPCHKYDAATLRALAELGFRTLSSRVRVDPAARLYYAAGRRLGRVAWLGGRVSYHGARTPHTGLAEVSVAVDVDEDVDWRGRKIVKDADRLWREFETAARREPWVGVMLHHEKYDEPGRIAVLRSFVARLAADPRVRFASLPELAAACAA
jgi:hypothetical protein